MKRSDFEKEFEEEFQNWGHNSIREQEEYYIDYTIAPSEEYIDEIFSNNYEQLLEEFAEMKGIKLI